MVTMGRWNIAYLIGIGAAVSIVSGIMWSHATYHGLGFLPQTVGDVVHAWSNPEPYAVIAIGSMLTALFRGEKYGPWWIGAIALGITYTQLRHVNGVVPTVALSAGLVLCTLIFLRLSHKPVRHETFT